MRLELQFMLEYHEHLREGEESSSEIVEIIQVRWEGI